MQSNKKIKSGPPLLFSLAEGNDSRQRAEAALTFQLFADSMERYDLLLLEIRHLQTNLINSMRFSDLNAALRFEESFIFGGAECHDGNGGTEQHGWSTIFNEKRFGLTLDKLARLAEAFVPVLPTTDDDPEDHPPRSADVSGMQLHESADRRFPEFEATLDVRYAWRHVLGPASRELRRRRLTNRWDDAFDLNYSTFIALQSLKRNIVVDKLYVAWYGVRAFVHPHLEPQLPDLRGLLPPKGRDGMPDPATMTPDRQRRADFTIMRGASLYNLNDHVQRLADFQEKFESTLDVGSQENHRPITGRRREQGIYNFMLGERTRDMFLEMSNLTRELLDEKHRDTLFGEMPSLLHHWSHEYSSRNEALVSFSRSARREKNRRATGKDGHRSSRPAIAAFAINTSFWMPDRPDLQPVIAHEAAHCVLVELFGEFIDPADRANRDGPLFDLWRALLTADREIRGDLMSNKDRLYEMREIVADLMAATITGPAYLFALYQKLEGWTLGQLARRDDWREWSDLGRIEDVLKQGTGHAPMDLRWYVRLYVMVRIMKQVFADDEGEYSVLLAPLLDGIESSLEATRMRLAGMVSGFDDALVGQWHELANSLAKQVETVGTVGALKSFYRQRYGKSEKTTDKARLCWTADRLRRDTQDEPLQLPYLDPEIRNRLIEYLIERKTRGTSRPAGHLMLGQRRLHDLWKRSFIQAKKMNERDGQSFSLKEKEVLGLLEDNAAALQKAREETYGTGKEALEKNLCNHVRNDSLVAAHAVAIFVPTYLDSSVKVHERLQQGLKKVGDWVRAVRQLNDERSAQADVSEEAKDTDDRITRAKEERRRALDGMLAECGIFGSLSDIPWETTFIRAMELTAGCGDDEYSNGLCPVRTLSADYAPGREIMQLAIELWSYGQRRAVDTLGEAVRLVRNLLDLPVSNALPVPHGALPKGTVPLLNETVALLTEGDAEKAACRIERAAEVWKKHDALTALGEDWSQIATDLRAGASPDRETLCNTLAASLRETLTGWLGAPLDGDFGDLEIQDFWRRHGRDDPDTKKRVANLERAFKSDAISRLRNASVTLRTTDLDKLLVDGSEVKDPDKAWELLVDMQSTGWLRDRAVQTVRLFEMGRLIANADRVKGPMPSEDRGTIETALATVALETGAQQIIKLDRSYPDIVFPLWLIKGRHFEPIDLCAILLARETASSGNRKVDALYGAAKARVETARAQEEPSREMHKAAVDAVRKWAYAAVEAKVLRKGAIEEWPVEKALRSMKNGVVQEFLRYWLDGDHRGSDERHMPSVASVVRLAARTQIWIEDFLTHIVRYQPLVLVEAAEALLENDLRQRDARPFSLRQMNEHVMRRRIAFIAARKLETLEKVFDFDALPLPEIEPMRTLVQRQGNRGQDPSIEPRRFLRALSKGCAGLRTFRTYSMSRQSLINSHWWGHEAGQGDAAPDSAPYGHFYQVGPGATGEEIAEQSDPAIRAFTTLGRYDYFSFSNDAVLNHHRQPILDHSLETRDAQALYTSPMKPFSRLRRERVFRSFFERRENATGAALSGEPVNLLAPEMTRSSEGDSGVRSPCDVLCILSLRLDRRSSRLEFIDRLRRARRNWVAFRDSREELAEHDDLTAETAMEIDPPVDKKVNPTGTLINPYRSLDWRQAVARRLHRSVQANPMTHEAREIFDEVFKPSWADPKKLAERYAALARNTGNAFKERDGPFHMRLCFEAARMAGDLPMLSLEALGYFLQDGDCALMGEGWGDLYLVFFCDTMPEKTEGMTDQQHAENLNYARHAGARRLYDVFAIQHILFQDHEVYRTEMFLGPAALPFAATDAQDRFQLSVAVRLREDRELDGLVQRTIRSMRHNASWMLLGSVLSKEDKESRARRNDTHMKATLKHVADTDRDRYAKLMRDLKGKVRISHIPGRNDLEFWIDSCADIRNLDEDNLSDLSPSAALVMVHELAGSGEENRGGGSEEISTRVGFRHFMMEPKGS